MANIKIDSFKLKAKNGDTYELSVGSVDTSTLASKDELDALKEQVEAGGGGINLDEFAKKSELDEFDTNVFKDELNTIIANAKNDIVTKENLDSFNTEAYKQEVSDIVTGLIDDARDNILTLDKFDEFDAAIYKDELNTIVEGARAEFSILDNLTQIDIAQLKEEMKAEILAELRG